MIKYFHELTEAEFNEKIKGKLTYAEASEQYPQPPWCTYPDATRGAMGCWSLVGFRVTGEGFCNECECFVNFGGDRGK